MNTSREYQLANMAQRRMFSMQIVDSDAFMEMPGSSQLLYFHLGMRADNEGFIGNPRGIIKRLGSGDDDYKVLLAKKFIIEFESGVCVIKHWLMHNIIQVNRYAKTGYVREKSLLFLKENRSYTMNKDNADMALTERLLNAKQLLSNDLGKLNKIKLNKTKLNKEIREPSSLLPVKKEEKKKYGEFENVLLTDGEMDKLYQRVGEANTHIIIEELSGYIASKGKRYSSHYATLLGWARRKIESHVEKKSNQRTIV